MGSGEASGLGENRGGHNEAKRGPRHGEGIWKLGTVNRGSDPKQ